MKTIRVSQSTKKAVIDSLGQKKKIQAIKTLRAGVVGPKLSLRDAKFAIDRLENQLGLSPQTPEADWPVIVCGPKIKKIIVDYGYGEIEVDIEGMEMRALMSLQSIGLDACRDILDFVDAIKAYSDGHTLVVVDKQELADDV